MIIYAIYRYRINELLKRQAIRNKIAQDLHDNMGSTLSSISVYSQVAKIQHAKGNKQVLEDVLGKIASTSSEMISEMNDIVWAINPRNDSMEKILQRMDSFAKPLLAAKNIQFSFSYEPEVLSVNLEMQKRKNFYLIFKESINNALKYSGATMLNVTVSVKGSSITPLSYYRIVTLIFAPLREDLTTKCPETRGGHRRYVLYKKNPRFQQGKTKPPQKDYFKQCAD